MRRRFDRLDGVHVFNVEASHALCQRASLRPRQGLAAVRCWRAGTRHTRWPPASTSRKRERPFPIAIPARIFRMLVQELSDEHAVVREGNLLRLPDHRIAVPDADRDSRRANH